LPDPFVGIRAVPDLERTPEIGKLRRFIPFGAGEHPSTS